MTRSTFSDDLDAHGVVRASTTLDPAKLSWLWSVIQPETADGTVATRSGVYGARALLVARPELRQALAELNIDDVAARALGERAFAIDALFFDKNSDANWAVPAHQDVVIPVPSSVDLSCVRNVRARHGVTHGEPPVHVLRELVAVRVHFDDSGMNTGGLSLVPGSHSRGRLSDADIRRIPSDTFRHCACHAGDVLLMKPLVVHRSARAAHPTRRRVLHVLYAPAEPD